MHHGGADGMQTLPTLCFCSQYQSQERLQFTLRLRLCTLSFLANKVKCRFLVLLIRTDHGFVCLSSQSSPRVIYLHGPCLRGNSFPLASEMASILLTFKLHACSYLEVPCHLIPSSCKAPGPLPSDTCALRGGRSSLVHGLLVTHHVL